jgi:hypothetical protein
VNVDVSPQFTVTICQQVSAAAVVARSLFPYEEVPQYVSHFNLALNVHLLITLPLVREASTTSHFILISTGQK